MDIEARTSATRLGPFTARQIDEAGNHVRVNAVCRQWRQVANLAPREKKPFLVAAYRESLGGSGLRPHGPPV
jgi:hypothetical protein